MKIGSEIVDVRPVILDFFCASDGWVYLIPGRGKSYRIFCELGFEKDKRLFFNFIKKEGLDAT